MKVADIGAENDRPFTEFALGRFAPFTVTDIAGGVGHLSVLGMIEMKFS